MMCHTENKRLPWQPLITMVVDKICKMTVRGVKLKSGSFFSISYGVLELWRKTLKSAPSADMVNKGKFLRKQNETIKMISTFAV